jgi:hypothetical protein
MIKGSTLLTTSPSSQALKAATAAAELGKPFTSAFPVRKTAERISKMELLVPLWSANVDSRSGNYIPLLV